jgi:hypothetical protein
MLEFPGYTTSKDYDNLIVLMKKQPVICLIKFSPVNRLGHQQPIQCHVAKAIYDSGIYNLIGVSSFV